MENLLVFFINDLIFFQKYITIIPNIKNKEFSPFGDGLQQQSAECRKGKVLRKW